VNPFKNKKGLGRGLSSLIGDIPNNQSNNTVPISSLLKNKFQPRKIFDKEKLNELTESIKERGIIQPIIVRKSNVENNKFEIIAGERRWLAAQNAGLHEIPVVEVEADDLKSLEFAIVENVQRNDLNPIEEAKGYKRLIDEFAYDQEKVGKFIGKSRSHISNCLRLLSLPPDVIELIEKNFISQGHAKILVGLPNASSLAKKFLDKKMSVRQAENLIKLLKVNRSKGFTRKDPNILEIENSLLEKIGLNVVIKNNKKNRGIIYFEYKDIDQLNRLINVVKSYY
tara:strand:- start:4893 stop:5741 length:849 start_codon:yes stop_codon:yes gene_type:complete